MFSQLRQLLQPAAFRIDQPQWPANLAALQQHQAAIAHALKPPETSRPPLDDSTDDPRVGRRSIADLGTGLWRLRQRLVDSVTGQPIEATRRAYRHFESAWDTLADAGVEIQDHTNDSFDPGQSLKVIAFQPTTGLTHDAVIETIRPSIYFKGQRIQIGEVIVGTPA